MHHAGHTTPPRRGFGLLALLALVALFAITLTQCKLVGERLTGVNAADVANAENCFRECAFAYNDSIKLEIQIHKTNEQACNRNPICRALEEARHDAAIARISAGRRECMANCHHQGGGAGGR